MADRDYRWRDERSWRRPGGERDFYRRDEYGEDDYGLGYGEEGLTNYRLLRERGARYPGGEREFGAYGRARYGAPGEQRRDFGRGDLEGNFRQIDQWSDFSGDQYYGRGRGGRRGWEDRHFNRLREREDERGFWDRAGDEVASWFGDEDAGYRRRLDARHEGRGPKGYRRSDDRIREDISDRLTDDPFIDASDIEINVANAEVTLTGSVDSRGARRRAEDLAERVSGVTHVQNNLRVAVPSEATHEESGVGKSRSVFSKS